MTNPRPRRGRLAVHVAFLAATLATGCNAAFGIHEGKPRPICADPEMIDDMEDGAGDICALNGRQGYWYTVGDGIITDLTPRPGSIFSPTVIPGGRGTSRYAARMTGSGATMWGALMGFNLNGNRAGRATYDASATGGIKFWMKSNAAVSVEFLVPETVLPSDGGACLDTATNVNCDNHFSFLITKPSNDWTEYEVPFAALTQRDSQTSGALTAPPLDGSATWNPKLLLAIQFALAEAVSSSAAFDVWIDDVSFYFCSTATCTPTCHDPDFSVACPATAGGVTGSRAYPASCRPVGTDCAAVATWCADPLIIDDMEDGDRTICDSGKRRGTWNVSGDGTSTDLEPGLGQSFTPTLIQGGRGASR